MGLRYVRRFRSRIHFYMPRDITEIIMPQPRFELHASCIYVSNLPDWNTICSFDVKPGNCDGDRAALENRLEIKLRQTEEHMGCNRQFTWGPLEQNALFAWPKVLTDLHCSELLRKKLTPRSTEIINLQKKKEKKKEEGKGKEVVILHKRKCHLSLNFGRGKGWSIF